MKFRTTWILLVLAAVAAIYFFFVEQPRHRSRTESSEREQQLTPIGKDEVVGVTIERESITIELRKEQEGWKLVRPVRDRADEAAANTLSYSLIDAVIERRIEAPPESLGHYGLAEPRATVTLSTMAEPQALVLEIGDLSLTKSHCYARRRGDGEVVLLPAGIHRYALRDLFEFRRKTLIDFLPNDVDRLEIIARDHQHAWRRLNRDRWFTVDRGDTILGDVSEIQSVLGVIRGLRATSVIERTPENENRYFGDRRGTVILGLAGSVATLLVGTCEEGECFVMLEGEERISGTSSYVLDVIAKTVHDLRDRRAVRYDPENVRKIRIMTGDLIISIVRSGTTWSYVNPDLGPIDQNAVSELLRRLGELKFREIVEENVSNPEKYGFDQPAYRLALFDSDDRVVDELTAGDPAPGLGVKFATNRSSGDVGLIDTEPLDELEEIFKAFRFQ